MILTRYTARIIKPLWPSVTARYSSVGKLVSLSCRTISTGRDHLRYGKNDPSVLDDFIGKWTEIKSLVQHFSKRIEGGKAEAPHIGKTWISFSRDGDEWTCTKGFTDTSDRNVLTFKLNEPKYDDSDGTLRKIFIFQDGDKMVERSVKFGDPSSVTLTERSVDSSVMTTKYIVKGEETIVKTYGKEK